MTPTPRSPARTPSDAAFAAWALWREQAARVQASWDEVLGATRGTRSAAFAEYGQALRREELAAAQLRARVGESSRSGPLAA